ncbi:MAG: hypothetical protein L0H79_09525 [Intrasporangium sp.]|uniref:hypothetical protein n=1 Tax=Intrasporangium sp. TaxID=1925024 RepID=UPI0026487A18|nr:hypothetical protein [Intrasporangium sp.]MDN5795973.1 hypothetical protein [Intrasporangium sp.]
MTTVPETLERLGGVATRAELLRSITHRQLEAAVRDGSVLRPRRNRYVSPQLETTRALAHELSAVASHRSAALEHGWKVKTTPEIPELTVPRGRKLTPEARAGAVLRTGVLTRQERKAGVTAPLATVFACARAMPFDEALAIADSALRSGTVRARELAAASRQVSGPGRPQVVRVLRHASPRAANPFESVLRAISLDVPGLDLVPQVRIQVADGLFVVPDLVDRVRRIVVEADSHEFHTKRRQLTADCWRYAELGLAGWRVFRFSWEQAMFEQAWVRWVLTRAVDPGAAPPIGANIWLGPGGRTQQVPSAYVG